MQKPKIVLFEGVNRVGKTTVIRLFRDIYGGKQIEVIKFPFQKQIAAQIVFLYREIDRMTDPDQIRSHLEIIHQLFDLDFRQFNVLKRLDDPTKIYFLDRYYPSNLVYASMHSVRLNPLWAEGHYLTPDITILLKITEDLTKTKYINDFPAYDNMVETGNNSISTSIQILTPRQLLWEGQVIYENMLNNLVLMKNLNNWYGVEALREDTFRNCEKLLLWHGIL